MGTRRERSLFSRAGSGGVRKRQELALVVSRDVRLLTPRPPGSVEVKPCGIKATAQRTATTKRQQEEDGLLPSSPLVGAPSLSSKFHNVLPSPTCRSRVLPHCLSSRNPPQSGEGQRGAEAAGGREEGPGHAPSGVTAPWAWPEASACRNSLLVGSPNCPPHQPCSHWFA